MLGPTRALPCVGGRVQMLHFGGAAEAGEVVSVAEEGRRLLVCGADGELHEFVLSPANARFVSAASAHGPRLELQPASGERELTDG